MDAISDRVFDVQSGHSHKIDETPSLLTLILDINPLEWKNLTDTICLKEVISCLLVTLNSHLALNSSNKVAIYVANSYSKGACLIYPKSTAPSEEGVGSTRKKTQKPTGSLVINKLYRQFAYIDQIIVDEICQLIQEQPDNIRSIIKEGKESEGGKKDQKQNIKGSLSGAISMALSYFNKMQHKDELNSLKTRLLVVSVSSDQTLSYIPMMNCIFAAQKMKILIDVCKLNTDSTFLQQAADLTNGVYIFVNHPKGLIQYLTTALFIDPSLRPLLVLPTNSNIDFRASCFITNQVIDIGYVCSVCLCILSMVPTDDRCPTCHSQFDKNITTRLKRKPKVLPLKSKKDKQITAIENGTSAGNTDAESRASSIPA